MRVVIVGAGLSGLSAACHLAGRGHEVTVLERDSLPGGRAGRLDRGGYCFDTGPTVLTMPALLKDTFAAAGVEMADFLTLRPVDPMYRATFADGSVIHVRHGREAMTEEIRTVCGSVEASAFGRFVDWLVALYDVEMSSFIDRNFDSALDLVRAVGPAARLLRLGGARRLSTKVNGFFADERLRRLFTFQSMYAGLAPYEALAVYGVITYMDSVGGVYFPAGGMHAVPAALAAAAEKAAAVFRYDTPVESIVLANGSTGAVRGVRLAGGELIPADAVVCSPDLPAAYRTLVPGLAAPRVTRTGRYSPSAFVLHLGVGGRSPPALPTTTSTSGASGRTPSVVCSTTGAACPTPRSSSPCPRSVIRRWRRPAVTCSSCWSRCRTWTGGWTGQSSVSGRGPTCGRGSTPAATRATPRWRRSSIRLTGSGTGWSVAPRSP